MKTHRITHAIAINGKCEVGNNIYGKEREGKMEKKTKEPETGRKV